jgi:hypothetical protein
MTSIEITDIQRRMALIRHDMHLEVHEAVKGAHSLTDWRNFVKDHPWLTISVGLFVGYLVVPWRRAGSPTVLTVGSPSPDLLATAQLNQSAKAPNSKSNALGTVFSLLAPIVVRAGQNYALNFLEAWLARHPLPPGGSRTRPASAQSQPTRSDLSGRIREFC